jgi:hypothetical protein
VIQENNPGFLVWETPGFSQAYWLLKNRILSLHYCRPVDSAGGNAMMSSGIN